jgi:HK97 family phage major capsid protein
MKTITQYREEISSLTKKIADIDAKAIAENRNLTKEELDLKREMFSQINFLNYTIATQEEQERIMAGLNTPGAPATVERKQPNSPYIQVTDRKGDRFNSLGEQLTAVIQAGRPGGHVDPRLLNAATGLSETVQSDGGFLIQSDFANRLFEDTFNNGLVAGRCEKVPISANSNSIVINGYDETSRASSTFGGIVIYHEEEAAEKTATKPKFRRVELSLKKLIGMCYLTDELMMDVTAMQSRIGSAFQSAFDFQVQDDLVNGTGAGMALGVLNAGCLVSVDKETGQNADTVVAENIPKMYSRRFAARTGNYIWLYNQQIEPQLFSMSMAVGTGGIPVYMPPGGLSDTPYGRIMGLPAYAIEQCAALGDAGDIVLANFTDGYIMATKGGLQQDMSIHVRFVYDESVLRFVLRMDGQPWRASALTPYKGGSGATQSHFITLAARA